MRKLIVCVSILYSLVATAQNYNNEWIDYTKIYYKFKVGKTGLYRINQSALPTAIANTPAENFQLWRNGKEIVLYTSTATGPLPINGFIEFWGEMNDGLPDKPLYKNASYQMCDKYSLQTDTAAYFLTINTATTNLRFTDINNNVTANTLTAEASFLYAQKFYFNEQINRGYGDNVGERVTSSTYDIGEGWSSRDIYEASPYTFTATNLFPATTGGLPALSLAVTGVSYNSRTVSLKMNGSAYIANQVLFDNIMPTGYANGAQVSKIFTSAINAIPMAAISTATNNFSIEIAAPNDNTNRVVANYVELKYYRQFNFANATNFSFTIPQSTNVLGNYIEITNFNSTAIPVLYDITNNKRMVAVVAGNIIKFALPFSSVSRDFILVSQDAASINLINSFSTKNFINYSATANQANYLIVSNKLLGINAGESVDLYRQYRASTLGGNFNTKIFDIDELVDQFAFGIKKHPLSIKNFIRFAKQKFAVAPTHLLLMGKGVVYDEYRYYENNANADKLNLIPTFGWPASDMLLVSSGSSVVEPLVMVGRVSAVTPQEVNIYLQKVKEYEAQAANTTQNIANKLWMKNFVHVAGSNDVGIEQQLIYYLNGYKNIIKDTLVGANVIDFNSQATGGGATPAVIDKLKNLFSTGISLLTYFGHSAASRLDYNLNNPYDYDNIGKYPMFLLNGCNSGNFFDYDTSRMNSISSFSEKFVFAQQRGAIGVIASSHFGLTSYLDAYSSAFYQSLKNANGYKNFVGKNIIDAIAPVLGDYLPQRMHSEQFILHGDPAIKIYAHDKPDFVVEEPSVSISPASLTVADSKFSLKTIIHNIGKAQAARTTNSGDSLLVSIKWQHGDGSVNYLYNQFIKPSVRYADSIVIDVPIVASRDNGNNCITILIDSLNQYDELSKSNNTITKCFFVFDNDIKPVFPYTYAIVNKNTSKLYASTANPLAIAKQYIIELDTTELFNSAFKITKTVTSAGGVVEFDPQTIYKDSTVYYWRVAPVSTTGVYKWNNSSFVYLNGTEVGFNQSHVYQHLKNTFSKIYLDSISRLWMFTNSNASFTITQSIYPFVNSNAQFSIALNGSIGPSSACLGHSVIFSVYDPVTLKPWYNQITPSTQIASNPPPGGFMGSAPLCYNNTTPLFNRQWNFEFSYLNATERQKAKNFLDYIPNGYIVIARLNLDQDNTGTFNNEPLVANWKSDQNLFGVGNTLYDKLKSAGFAQLDSFNRPRTWAFIYAKNANSVTPTWAFSNGASGAGDVASMTVNATFSDTLGTIHSTVFGPAASWKTLKWRGFSSETNSNDIPLINIIGINIAGVETTLFSNINLTQQDFNLSSINATLFPYIKIQMSNADRTNLTPYQLRYWRLIADLVPEGAIAPNIKYNFKDTLEVGEKLNVAIAFKNISETNFADSIAVQIKITDKNNVVNSINTQKLKKPLVAGDTATIIASIDTKNFSGNNNININVNPNNSPPEQYHFNNFINKNFFVQSDQINPFLDVTFDGAHILNGDIVSSKPSIQIKLKDEAKYLPLNDTAGITVQLRYPDYSFKRFKYGTDTLQFTPANITNSDNTATTYFSPTLTQDGEYELFVKGKDMSNNNAGTQEYRVTFNVNNKPMISDVFNYPNPFTTSTAFVFTLTGNQVPNTLRIQILTVTGKIVREINKEELGNIKIGRNITSFKWDGTDSYGQKLANGVYLYRIITNLNGNALDKFNLSDSNGDKINTNKFFKGGYGKMYLMR